MNIQQKTGQKRIIGLLLLLLIIGMGGCSKAYQEANVVLVVIDTLRSDRLPMYFFNRDTSPFLNRLSQSSTVFKHCYAPSSWTAPATASLFTSMYPFQHGVLMGLMAILNQKKADPTIKINKIPAEIETLTEVLKKAGYRTFGIADNANIDKKEGFDQGFDRLKTYNYQGASKVNETALAWKEKIRSGGKYFLYLHYMDPHAPYFKQKPWYREGKKGKIPISLEAYLSEISYADSYIEKLYEAFNWDENTIFIVTSDHGEGLWDHGTMGHGLTLHREELQVPLLIRLPEGNDVKTVEENVSLIDIMPTIRDLVGLNKSLMDEGQSLEPLIFDEPNDLSNRFLFSHLVKKQKEKRLEISSVIYKKWHLITDTDGKNELYNLHTDRMEKFNKYNDPRSRKLSKKLKYQLRTFRKNCRKYQSETKRIKISDKENKRLKTLGYINVEDK